VNLRNASSKDAATAEALRSAEGSRTGLIVGRIPALVVPNNAIRKKLQPQTETEQFFILSIIY
jgi:hypothetical protein